MAFYDDRRGLDDYDDDYHYDTDYGKHDSSSYPIMPDIIKKFILHFRDVIQNGSISDKQTLYESTFPKLTEQYYDNSPWPTDREILKELPEIENSNDDHIFLVLYSELCYRHIYARVPGGPSLEQRFESFYHYSALLDWILSSPEPVRLELPDQWLWELIDEFIYQFQSYAQYRARLHQKSPSELEKLESASKIWNVLSILNVLHVFVDKSNIKQQLESAVKSCYVELSRDRNEF